ncbi:MAG: geranylgeranyl reductase family protein [Nitrospirota bacterium]|jgi:geranylgeranyl reductase family protein
MTYDCIIAGLGPAGSSAAYYLARKGLSVLALDREKFPRHKPCGGCVSSKTERFLDADFKSVVDKTVNGAVFSFKGKGKIEFRDDSSPVGYMVSRKEFDAYLVKKAKGAGAKVVEGERVLKVEETEDSVRVSSSKDEYTGRYLIGADGVNSIVAKELGLAKDRKFFLTIDADVKVRYPEELSDLAEIDIGAIPYGYGWVFPKNGYLSVGVASVKTGKNNSPINLKEHFAEFIKKRPFLKDASIKKVCAFRLPTQIGANAPDIVGRNTILAGDAAGLVDPLVGEGIYYAIMSGHLAGETIYKALNNISELSDYKDKIDKELISEFRLAWKAANIIYHLPRFWFGVIKTNKKIVEFYYKVLRGDETYSSFVKKLKTLIPFSLLPRSVRG